MLCPKVCICKHFQQWNLSAPAVFVRQLPVLPDRKKPSRPFMEEAHASILRLSHQAGVQRMWSMWPSECVELDDGCRNVQSCALWCSCMCYLTSVMKDSDEFVGLLKTCCLLDLHSSSVRSQYFSPRLLFLLLWDVNTWLAPIAVPLDLWGGETPKTIKVGLLSTFLTLKRNSKTLPLRIQFLPSTAF